jgi:hypothetical protein
MIGASLLLAWSLSLLLKVSCSTTLTSLMLKTKKLFLIPWTSLVTHSGMSMLTTRPLMVTPTHAGIVTEVSTKKKVVDVKLACTEQTRPV